MEELDWSRMMRKVAYTEAEVRLQGEREGKMRSYEDAILKSAAADKTGDLNQTYAALQHLRRAKKALRTDDRHIVERKLSFV
jgi:hypothetical protein